MKLHQKIFFHPITTPHLDSLYAFYFGMENVIAKIPSCKTSSCEYEYEVQNEREREKKKNECEFAKWTYGGGISDILFEYV